MQSKHPQLSQMAQNSREAEDLIGGRGSVRADFSHHRTRPGWAADSMVTRLARSACRLTRGRVVFAVAFESRVTCFTTVAPEVLPPPFAADRRWGFFYFKSEMAGPLPARRRAPVRRRDAYARVRAHARQRRGGDGWRACGADRGSGRPPAATATSGPQPSGVASAHRYVSKRGLTPMPGCYCRPFF